MAGKEWVIPWSSIPWQAISSPRTAIPVDRHFEDEGVSRKLVRGHYLETDVHGGSGAVNSALDRMNNYISDYGRTVMAIPFP